MPNFTDLIKRAGKKVPLKQAQITLGVLGVVTPSLLVALHFRQ